MDYDVRLEQRASQTLAVVRRRASPQQLARVVPDACGTVWNALKAAHVTGAGRHVAIYWDGVINLEVGVELETPFAGHGEVVPSSTPAGTVATVVHLGPYNRLGDAHKAIRDWCAHHGFTPAGPNWEIYGHWKDEWNSNPDQIRTDVFYLLKS